MALSVIVTAYGSAETLRDCVAALRNDPDVAQILVADCSEEMPVLPVAVRQFPTPTSVPVMRWAMLPMVTEPVVAILEGRCVPPVGWAGDIAAAHRAHPKAKGIGGGVDLDPHAEWLDTVVWFCEYGAFAPPLTDAPAADISGAHLSYKTDALHAEKDLLAAGAWETLIHLRWPHGALRTTAVCVTFRNGMSFGRFAQQRFVYGRGYAAARCSDWRRWLYALMTPALPIVLTLRTGLAARRMGRFMVCLPGILFFHSLWSCGELVGYWFGASRKQHIY